jgi:hypothetical protein
VVRCWEIGVTCSNLNTISNYAGSQVPKFSLIFTAQYFRGLLDSLYQSIVPSWKQIMNPMILFGS